MESTQWKQEQEHLNETLDTVGQELAKCERALGIENGNDRFIMVQDDQSSDALVQQQIMRMTLDTLHQLRLSVKSPYFARLYQGIDDVI